MIAQKHIRGLIILLSTLIYSLIIFPLLNPPSALTQTLEPASTQNTPSTSKTERKRILFIGDSLTDGAGLLREDSYPSLIAKKIELNNLAYSVQNAGVSGDTSAGGLRRIDWLLRSKVDVAVIALGANDGLRGLETKKTEENLVEIIQKIKLSNPDAKVLLVGMLISPNMGPEYEQEFRAVFPNVAKRTNVAFLPFLLEGVAAIPKLNLPDGIHPNQKGHEIMAESVWKKLRPLL